MRNSVRSTQTPSLVHRRAFTLIELLIVVAIIAILAAIAVPNFLEAQTRAKVSRVKSDHRTIVTAIESYRVDNNTYYLARFYESLPQRLKFVTTPVAYISSVPLDPFYGLSQTNFGGLDNSYAYASGNIWSGADNVFEEYARTLYTIAGRGPDRNFNFGGVCTAHPDAEATNAFERGSYDPTNGSASPGDIIRKGAGTLGRNQPI
jgi:prepilin-type N-terminal cleavage/methylation domain-containing protein